jgi:hypothetical protein
LSVEREREIDNEIEGQEIKKEIHDTQGKKKKERECYEGK